MLVCRKLNKSGKGYKDFVRIVRSFSSNDKDDLLFNPIFQFSLSDSANELSQSLSSHFSKTKLHSSTQSDGSEFNTISPGVIFSMIKAGFDKKDYETVRLVIDEAKLLGKLSGEIIEKSLIECIHSKQYNHAMFLFTVCNESNYTVSNPACKLFHAHLINQCFWRDAAVVAEYMIYHNYVFKNQDMFFLISGLMKESSQIGMTKSLKLLQLIAEHRRDDLSSGFDFSKAKSLAIFYVDATTKFGSTGMAEKIPVENLNATIAALLDSLNEHNWWSFNLCKMLVALACVAGHTDSAVTLIRESITGLVNKKIKEEENQLDKTPSNSSSSSSSSLSENSGINRMHTNSYIPRISNTNNTNNNIYTNKNHHTFTPATATATVAATIAKDITDYDSCSIDSPENYDILSVIRGLSQGAGLTKSTHFRGRGAVHFKRNDYTVKRYRPTSMAVPSPPPPVEAEGEEDSLNILSNHHHHHDSSSNSRTNINHYNNNNNSSSSNCHNNTNSSSSSHNSNNNSDDSLSHDRYYTSQIVSETLLELSTTHLQHLNVIQGGPLNMITFLNTYWILAHKVSLWTVNPIQPDESLIQAYAKLLDFYNDEMNYSHVFSIKAGYERRNFLMLCDALGLKHKIKENDRIVNHHHRHRNNHHYNSSSSSINDDDYIIRVWKPKSNQYSFFPPTLQEILIIDANKYENRKFDGLPPFWDKVEESLKLLSERDLQVVINTILPIMRGYPSSSWALKCIDLFHDKNYQYPKGFLRNLLAHCKERNDAYGVLEVLYLAKKIDNDDTIPRLSLNYSIGSDDSDLLPLPTTTSNNKNKNKNTSTTIDDNNNDDYDYDNDDYNNHDERLDTKDQLTNQDWNRACNTAWHGHLSLPPDAFQHCFDEVIQLMRDFGVVLESHSIRILMRYLVRTQPYSPTTISILKRVYYDPMATIIHWESISLTILIDIQMTHGDKYYAFQSSHGISPYRLVEPLYRNEHYLVIYQTPLEKLVDHLDFIRDLVGEEFLQKFYSAWRKIRNSKGRYELYQLLLEFTQSKKKIGQTGYQEKIISDFSPDARYLILTFSVYSAFLMVSEEHEFRKGYDLLMNVKLIIDGTNEMYFMNERDMRDYEEEMTGGRKMINNTSNTGNIHNKDYLPKRVPSDYDDYADMDY